MEFTKLISLVEPGNIDDTRIAMEYIKLKYPIIPELIQNFIFYSIRMDVLEQYCDTTKEINSAGINKYKWK